MTHVSELINSDRADAVLRRHGLDGLLAALPENWLYLTGHEDTVASTIGLPVVALLTRNPLGVRAIAIPRLVAGFAAVEMPTVDRVVLYGEFPVNVDQVELRGLERATVDLLNDRSHAAATLADAVELILRLTSLDRGQIAVDDGSIAQIVQERVPTCKCTPGRKVLEQIRAVKTPEEISRLGAAAAIVEEVEQLAFDHIRPGRVWDDFVSSLPSAVAQRGARMGFFSGGAGWRSGFMFPPVEEPIKNGDLVRLDLTISHRGYWSDSGRTACVGTPSPQVKKLYGGMRLAVEAALEAVRPGVPFAEVYDVAMKAVGQHIPGYRRRHCGHTIGLRPYDGLLVAPDEAALLETNMVLNIEVPYYGLGWGGLQLEDTVVVTENGYSPLTEMTHDLITVSRS
jgi:Xaa-Pro aminopeptidase